MGHMVKVILGGFSLLAVVYTLKHALALTPAAAVGGFLSLWLLAVLVNLSYGVFKAGYSLREELPIAAICMAVPAVGAFLL